MPRISSSSPGLRSVLPFEAAPAELSLLRRAVGGQLRRWGMPAMSDEVELVVTELASNVIKHVGEGVSATVVMEVNGDGLRVEMHDKSHELPLSRTPDRLDQDGRGLQLLASLARNWGVLLTATGKAVWCEIALEPVRHCDKAWRAAALLDEYRRVGGGPAALADNEVVLEETVTNVISDLLHWLTIQGGDPDDILDRALMRYEAEVDAAA